MAERELECDACGLPPAAPDLAAADDTGLPRGWVRRSFGRRTFTLCDCCGSIHHFKSGLSAYLQEALCLGPDAMCDFARSNEPGSGLHRLRIKPEDKSDDSKTDTDQ